MIFRASICGLCRFSLPAPRCSVAVIGVMLAAGVFISRGAPAYAQAGASYAIVHEFGTGAPPNDGRSPFASMIVGRDGNFYGTTLNGGSTVSSDPGKLGLGTVFKMTPGGTVNVLHSFGDGSVANDGLYPYASVVQGPDGNFYGTADSGGSTFVSLNGQQGYGVAFKVTPTGVMTILHSFGDGTVRSDGYYPDSNLTLGPDGNFYGTTFAGGAGGQGTIYRMTPAGAVTILHSFHDGTVANDGEAPEEGVTLGRDGNFYGVTDHGGSTIAADPLHMGWGTAYRMTLAGAVSILHSFGDGSVANDGRVPQTPLLQASDGNFYGMTNQGGSTLSKDSTGKGFGALYRLAPSGAVTILHEFGDGSLTDDGQNPFGSLAQGLDGNLYGTTINGGAQTVSAGVAFCSTLAGVVRIVHDFGNGTVTDDGSVPNGVIVGPDGSLYGTTTYGGTTITSDPQHFGYGVAFRLSVSRVRLDLNGDGYPDLLWYNRSTGQVVTWLFQGIRQTGAALIGTVGAPWTPVAEPDINGDGQGDILFWNPSTGQLAAWILASGGASIASGTGIFSQLTTDWHPAGIAEESGSYWWLIWRNVKTGGVAEWLFQGTTFKTSVFVGTLADQNWQIIGTPDLNRDGLTDILFYNSATRQLAGWLMNGPKFVSGTGVILTGPVGWEAVATPDQNADGYADILFYNPSSGQVAAWYLHGTTFVSGSGVFATLPDTNWQLTGLH